ncbi:MAG TPA: TOPRIM nucleotidyl transferase/hydrolase domain-containing protein [Streptosporangiaceae bacterium]|nr:TOPRIM nucleotidyl transferase/hydrolase domain-containing protein [Streptosporangiaceae bacterium]
MVGSGHAAAEAGRLDLYRDAGYEGAGDFTVRLGMDLDQAWESDLVWAFACAAFATGRMDHANMELDALVRHGLKADSLEPLCSGSLVVSHRAALARPWSAAWEFAHAGQAWDVVLTGDGSGRLRPGTAGRPPAQNGAGTFTDWLLGSVPEGDKSVSAPMDFRVAMQQAEKPVSFAAAGMPANRLPESLRALGLGLGIDPSNQQFGFDHVMALVLRRGIVLTDNRRLPLARRFGIGELGRETDLRDGSAVAAELFRLKMGVSAEQARFREIQAMFLALTGRELGLRARPGPSDDDGGSMIVEPTVAGFHGERLVELSGAGVQEALVLSALLGDRPGQVTVLDEPAVNLEATAQRRLVGRVRGPGQYLVITHSADLVPFEEPGDLSSIVRVAPGRSGSAIRQPDFGGVSDRDLLRHLRLMEPADVRALLFAAGVILCEGFTEVGALPRWWRGADSAGLPDPAAAHVSVLSVGGQTHFGPYLRYLDAFGVPWAVVADGPALRPGSTLAGDLRDLGCWPGKPQPEDGEDFPAWRDFWEGAGVFTLADQFGDDGSKSGEFEAFLERVDPALFAEAKRAGGRSKPRTGTFFALEHPEPPPGVLGVYGRIAGRLGLRGRGAARETP